MSSLLHSKTLRLLLEGFFFPFGWKSGVRVRNLDVRKRNWETYIDNLERKWRLWDEDLALVLGVSVEALQSWKEGKEEPTEKAVKELREINKYGKVTRGTERLTMLQARFTRQERLFMKDLLTPVYEKTDKQCDKEFIQELWQKL